LNVVGENAGEIEQGGNIGGDQVRRPLLMTLFCGIVTGSVACFLYSADVQFTFDNRTGSLLCLYASPEDASTGRCLNELEARDHDRKLIVGCGDGPQADSAPISVIMTVGPGGREIYNRTAECQVWQDLDRAFVIEQRGDEFSVTGPLPGVSPNP